MTYKLKKAVCTSILFLLSCAISAAELAPESVSGATTITPAEAKALFDREVAFIDVRGDQDYEAGRIPGAIHLSLSDGLTEESLSSEISKTDEVVFYCNGHKCKLSSEACAMAVSWGFKNVSYFREGMPGWSSSGYPVE